jgi:histidinol-phosphate phosphatase family protein
MITNQSAVGRGIVTSEFVQCVHEQMLAEIGKREGRFAGVYFCPHSPAAGCDCRKPAPGMLVRAADDLGIDLTASFMVGDSLTDMDAANAVGACGILVLTGKGQSEADRLPNYVSNGGKQPIIAADIGEAAAIICEFQQSPGSRA